MLHHKLFPQLAGGLREPCFINVVPKITINALIPQGLGSMRKDYRKRGGSLAYWVSWSQGFNDFACWPSFLCSPIEWVAPVLVLSFKSSCSPTQRWKTSCSSLPSIHHQAATEYLVGPRLPYRNPRGSLLCLGHAWWESGLPEFVLFSLIFKRR